MIGQQFIFHALVSLLFLVATITAAGTGQLACNETSMIVTFNKTVLDAGGRNYSIMFKGQSDYPCNVNATILSNTVGDTIQLVADYNECGIDVYQNNSVITYNQTVMVSYGENPASSVIFRVNYDEYSLKCHKSNNLTASMDVFNVTAEGKVFSKVGQSTFEIELHRYESTFTTKDTSGAANLGDLLYFQVALKTDRSDISMSPQNCYAVNTDGTAKYMLIEDRCPNTDDKTVSIVTTNSEKKTFQWQMESFRFFGASNEVYIKCDILVCVSASQDPRCLRCGATSPTITATNSTITANSNSTLPAKKRRDLSQYIGESEAAESYRQRRDLSSLHDDIKNSGSTETKEVSVRSGLIVLVDKNESTKSAPRSEPSVFAGTKGTIIIVLMALFVFVLAVAVIKKFFLTSPTPAHSSPVSMKTLECGAYDNKAIY